MKHLQLNLYGHNLNIFHPKYNFVTKERINRKTRFLVYRIAASIAVLITISSVLFFSVREKPETQIALNTPEKKTIEINKAQLLIKSEPKDKTDYRASKSREEDVQPVSKEAVQKSENIAIPDNTDKLNVASESRAVTTDEYVSGEKVSAPMAVMAKKKSSTGDTAQSDAYIHAHPEIGKSKFNDYLKNNLHKPDSTETEKKAVAILNFLVRTSGQLDSIRIVISPGKQYSDEAIRVLKSGPGWKPAEVNGSAVE